MTVTKDEISRFETSEFIFEKNTIRLRRNDFIYQELPLQSVSQITIRTGKRLKRWLVTLLLGAGLLAFVVFDVVRIAAILMNPEGFHMYIERLLIPFFPAVIGTYSVVIALRKTRVMIVSAEGKSYYLELHELIKKQEYDSFVKTLAAAFPALHSSE